MVLLAAFAALGPLSLDIYLPAVSHMAQELQASAREATASLSIFFVGMAIGQLFVGPWSDRVGRRLPLISGLIFACVGSLLCAGATGMPVLLSGRALQALGGSAVMVTGRAAVRDHLDERGSASFFSMLTMINSLMPIFAPSVGAAILRFTEWRGIFGLTAVVAGTMLVGTLFGLRESRVPITARPENPLRVYGTLLTNRRFLGLLVAAAANGASYFTYLALSPLVLMQIYGLSPSHYGLVLSLNGLGLISMTQANRLLLRKVAPRRILKAASLSAAILILPLTAWAFTFAGGLPVLIALVFVVIASSSFVQANSLAAAMSAAQGNVGSAAALFGAGMFGAGTVASFLGGLTFDGTPRSMVLLMAAAMLVMSLSLHFLAFRGDEG